MAETVREALRDRISLRTVVSWVALFGVLLWVFDEPLAQVGISIVTAAVLGVVELFPEVYDLRAEIGSLALGVVGLLSASALVAVGDGSVWVLFILALISAWMTLDAGQILRHAGLRTEETPNRDGHEIYQEYVTRRVDETLREQGLTRHELAAAVDADDAAIDRALSTLDDRGLLTRQGSELHTASPPAPGVLGRVRSGTGRIASRLARPLTIEFESDPEDGVGRQRSVDETSSTDDREREREPAGRH